MSHINVPTRVSAGFGARLPLACVLSVILASTALAGTSASGRSRVPTVGFLVASQSVGESAGQISATVQLSELSGSDVTVPFTLAGTATLGEDYTISASPLTIVAGELTANVEIVLQADGVHELDETIGVVLGTPQGAGLAPENEHWVTILEKDPPPVLRFTYLRSSRPESAGQVGIGVELSAVSELPVTLEYAAGGTAQDPEDYTIAASPLVIPAGATQGTILVDIVDDAIASEGPESIHLTVVQLTGATLGTPASHTLYIQDDDSPTWNHVVKGLAVEPSSLEFPLTNVGELGATFPVTLRNDNVVSVTFQGAFVDGEDAADFARIYGDTPPLVLHPGETATLDVRFEPQEKGLREARLRVRQKPPGVPTPQVLLGGYAYGPTGGELLLGAGNSDYSAVSGELWVQDFGVTGPTALAVTAAPIHDTQDDLLYQVARRGAAFGYLFPVPDGVYDVTLHFAEIEHHATGARVFDVDVEGERVCEDLDLHYLKGPDRAYQKQVRTEILDGELEISFAAQVGEALISAIEVRSVPLVAADPEGLDFGSVAQGEFLDLPLVLANHGLHAASLDSLALVVGGYEGARGQDFQVELGGQVYHGSSETVVYPIELDIPAGGQAQLTVTFEPGAHAENELLLRLEGNLDPVEIQILGIGGAADWGFLHPIIDASPSLAIDFDGDGQETLQLDAGESHTHEPGRTLAGFSWKENGVEFGTQVTQARSFALGETQIELTIRDDDTPPKEASEQASLRVFPASSVPGLLARYYDATGVGAETLLDNVPSRADFVERRDSLMIPIGPTVGGSTFTNSVMARLVADFEVGASSSYTFQLQGGIARRMLVDGLPVQGPVVLRAGGHTLDARFAVASLADLPLSVSVLVDGQPAGDFANALTHDESDVLPVIHDMPEGGNEAGGNLITISGFGFFPEGGVVVHWGSGDGGVDLTAADFVSYSAERIELISPPSPGAPGVTTVIDVMLQTPNGTSGLRSYTYSPDGEVPIKFVWYNEVLLDSPTCGAWGPDGRFWVGTLTGHLHAITYASNYDVVGVQTYAGVSGLTNHEILGIEFNPFDPPGRQPRVYLAHNALFAQGGGPFTGPSPYEGQVSVLEGPFYDTALPLITGLPSSNHDHGANGMEFDHNGDLFLAVGGNTNAGVRHPNIGNLPESPLSGAIVKAQLSRPDFDGHIVYLETDSGLPNDNQVFGDRVDVAPWVDVAVYAPGLRNAYDLVLTSWNTIYATDNGPNGSFGPASTGPASDGGMPGPNTTNDEILLIEEGNYYGHPNRNRGRYESRQNLYRGEGALSIAGEFSQAIGHTPSSTNGIDEYRAATFNGQMRGMLIVQKYNYRYYRLGLSPDRRRVLSATHMTPDAQSLDVVTGPGGALVTITESGKVKLFKAVDQAASGLTVYDIFPWRAPQTGGQRFVIGGQGFGTLANTSVTIGGVPAPLVSVDAQRIVGTIPAGIAPVQELVDVAVTVGATQRVLAGSFMALPATPGLAYGWWVDGPQVPEAIGEVAGGVIGGKLYLVGEGVSSNVKTYSYDLLNGFWTSTLPQRPFPGHHHGAEVWDRKLYLIGGLGAGGGKVQIFDPAQGAQGAWALGADMPWAGGSVATALIGGKIYAAGGIVGSGTVANAAMYDPMLDTWTPIAPMAVKVNHAASATDGQRFWVFGGRQGGNFPQPGFTTVQVYDPATDTWEASGVGGSTLQPMPSGRGGTGRAVWYKDRFFVFGGETSDPNDPEADPGRVFAQVFSYDPVGNSWRQDRRMPTARHGIFPLQFQDRIHVIAGGVSFGNSQSKVHEIFQRH